MDERTFNYLKGRFGDYYRDANLELPPEAENREWAIIPWKKDPRPDMRRHKSMREISGVSDFLSHKRPRHVYMSGAKYKDPGAPNMESKSWIGADLVFDLDAKDIESVNEDDSLSERLSKCQNSMVKLVEKLQDDFGFNDLQVVFSGGRGFHVHVRDDSVQEMDSDARSEIVDYVRGRDISIEKFPTNSSEHTLSGPEQIASLSGGWYNSFFPAFIDMLGSIIEKDEGEALEELQSYEGVGEKRARGILNTLNERYDIIRAGNLKIDPGIKTLADGFLKEYTDAEKSEVDEPVTNDTTRLIRFPGSLHGGTGLVVKRIDISNISSFDPLEDAVSENFKEHEIKIHAKEKTDVEMMGDKISLEKGESTVPEYAGILLMARGAADKIAE